MQQASGSYHRVPEALESECLMCMADVERFSCLLVNGATGTRLIGRASVGTYLAAASTGCALSFKSQNAGVVLGRIWDVSCI